MYVEEQPTGEAYAENVMVASPVPLVFVSVPDASGKAVPAEVQQMIMPAPATRAVCKTVKVLPLFVYVAPAVGVTLTPLTVNSLRLYLTALPEAFVNTGVTSRAVAVLSGTTQLSP